jgi:hypothetical protein
MSISIRCSLALLPLLLVAPACTVPAERLSDQSAAVELDWRASPLVDPRVTPAELREKTTMLIYSKERRDVIETDSLRIDSPPLFVAEKEPPSGAPITEPVVDSNTIRVERMLADSAKLDPNEFVPVIFTVDDEYFDFSALRFAETDAELAEMLEVRRAQVRDVTSGAIARLGEIGAEDVETFISASSIMARIPAASMRELAEWRDIKALAPAFTEVQPEVAYGVSGVKAGARITAIEAAGITGATNGRAGGRVRVGVVDHLSLFATHPGFASGGGTAFAATLDCFTGTTCSAWTPAAVGDANHGSEMARLASARVGGTIQSTADRDRSGTMNGTADLYYYAFSSTSGPITAGASLVRALDRAILDQLDVVVLSQNLSGSLNSSTGRWSGCCEPCNRDCDCGGVNQSLRSSLAAGVIVSKSIGNVASPSSGAGANACTATYPAPRPELVTVAGLDSVESTTLYNTLPIWTTTPGIPNYGSSRGGMALRVNGIEHPGAASVAVLAAPSKIQFTYRNTTLYETDDNLVPQGTSTANAVSAGALGVFRSGLANVGIQWSGRSLLNAAGLLTDSFQHGSTSRISTGFHVRSGAGRLNVHTPQTVNGTSAWSTVTGTLSSGQSQGWFMVPSTYGSTINQITQVQISMSFEEQTLSDAADIDLRLYYACAGSNNGSILRQDASRSMVSRIVFNRSDAPSALNSPNCWAISVYGYHVPAGQTRNFRINWFWHTDDPGGY